MSDTDRLAALIGETDQIGMTSAELAEQLIARGVTLPAEPPKPVELQCFFCGRTETENRRDGWGGLTDIRVVVADGEEGYGNILRLVCNTHMITTTVGLAELGFADHRHGGINFLEDTECPGHEDRAACPTPDPEE